MACKLVAFKTSLTHSSGVPDRIHIYTFCTCLYCVCSTRGNSRLGSEHAMLLFCVVFVYAFFCGLFCFRFICLCNEAEAVVVAVLCAFIWVALCVFGLKQEGKKTHEWQQLTKYDARHYGFSLVLVSAVIIVVIRICIQCNCQVSGLNIAYNYSWMHNT